MDGAQTAAAPAAASSSLPGVKDDRAGMLMYHMAKIRPLQDDHADKKAVATAAAETVNAALNAAVADLNNFRGPSIDKAWLLRRIAMARQKQRDLLEELELERWADGVQGFPVQVDAFGGEETPGPAKDALYYRAQGYQDGLNGQSATPPDGMHSMFSGDYEAGWGEGQAAQLNYIALGQALVDRQSQPSTQGAVDLNTGEEEDEDDEAKIAAEAKRLAKDPEFMARGDGGDAEAGGEKPDGADAKPKGKQRQDVH